MNPRTPRRRREREEEDEEEETGKRGDGEKKETEAGGECPRGGKWKKELHACSPSSRGAGGAGGPGELRESGAGGPGELAGATGCPGLLVLGGPAGPE